MKKVLLLWMLIIPLGILFAQDTMDDSPVSWELNLGEIDPILLPPLDLEVIRQEDSINDLDKSLPWRYGIARTVILDPSEAGEWSLLENGDRIWRVAIKSPRAINMSVNFTEFSLPEGTALQLFNAERTDKSKKYTSAHNRSNKELGSWFVQGETVFVEYYEPALTQGSFQIEINSIIHGYRLGRLDSWLEEGRGLNDSGDCNYDVNCPVGSDFDDKKDVVKKAVALLNLGNGYLCSASLINNTFLDKKPYLLTANHCLENSDPALWSVRFNWMSPSPVCGTEAESTDIQSNFTMSGAELRANNPVSDFALVELFNPIPSSWDVAFAGWDHSGANPEFQVGIHHPNGDIMKICRDDNPAVKENANGTDVWLIKGVTAGEGNGWEIGTTESGSSGSPLFNENGHIIGQLYAGQSFCNGIENNNEYDVYGRIGVSWNAGSTPENRLSDWLDPLGSGQMTIDALENALSTIDFEISGTLDVYPNPASEYVMIMNTRYPNLSYRLYNLLGQEIQSGNVSASENRIAVQNIQEGIYFLMLVDEETQNDITKKIIVDR
ncbi:MAG: T9SS type A sorting domain-containing protein [Flavobacteriaceae bacterium]|nr:T9SS type A sorting domain-containing protein [Flavobacteriaceae bacterium]